MEWYFILLISLACYIALCLILFIFPVCRKDNRIVIKHQDSDIILGAHRGGSLERLENTLPAFMHAQNCGMHILEMDVQLTKDKQVVVHHDDTLQRVTGVDRRVSDFDYNELPSALEEVPMHFGFEVYKQKPGIDDGKIPLLRDVFIQNSGIPINIDLKGGDEELMHEVYKLIIEFHRENITYFGDMDEKRNLIAKKMGEDVGIRTFASIKYTILICLAYFVGILQFIPFRHYSLWFPFFGRDKLDTICRILGNKCKHRCTAGLYRVLTYCMKPMFWHLRRRGVLVMFWNVNSEDEYERALTYSIDGILTDKPEEIRRIADKLSNRNASGSDEDLIPSRRKDS